MSSPADFGAGMNDGMGRALEKSGDSLLDVLEKKAAREDQMWRAKTVAEARMDWTNELLNRQKDAPEGAEGFSQSVISDFDKYAAEKAKGARNADSAKQLEVSMIETRAYLLEKSTIFEAAASAKKVRRDLEGTHEANRNSVRLDPGQYERVVADTDKLIMSSSLPAEKKAELRNEWGEQLAYEAAAGTILGAKSVAAAQAVRDEFRAKDNRWAAKLAPQNFSALLNSAERNVEAAERESLKAEAAIEKRRDIEATAAYVDLQNRAQRGENIEPELPIFRSRYGNTSAGLMKWSHLQTSANKFVREEAFARYESARVTAAITGQGNQLDPYVKEDRDAVDTHYSMTMESWRKTVRDPAELVSNQVRYAEASGIVPQAMKSDISSGLNNPSNPDRVVQAAGLMDQLFTANDQFKNQFSRDQISFGTEVNTYIRAGAAPGAAVEMATKNRQIPEAQRKARNDEFDILTKSSPPKKVLAKRFDGGWFGSAPQSDSVMAQEFETIRKQEFARSGNMDHANETAFKVLEGSWGATRVNGKPQMMKYAPEKFYGVKGLDDGSNSEWIRQQLIDDVKSNSMSQPGVEDRLILTPHPTKRQSDGRPMYQVILLQKDAPFQAIRDTKGEVMAWAPDYSRSKAFADREAEMQWNIQEAGRLRERNTPEGKARSRADINNAIIEAAAPGAGRF
jgi:hypothetical protein